MKTLVFLPWALAVAWLVGHVYPASFDSGSFVGAALITAALLVAMFLGTAIAGGPPSRRLAVAWGSTLALLVIVPGTFEAYAARAGDPGIDGFWSYLSVRAAEGVQKPGLGSRGRFLMWGGFIEHWLFPLIGCIGFMWLWADEDVAAEEGRPSAADRIDETLRSWDPWSGRGEGGGRRGSHGGGDGTSGSGVSDRGLTADDLHRAVNYDDLETIEAAFRQGVPVDAAHSTEGPYVFLAARRGFLEGVEAFLDNGLDPRIEDPNGRTLLHAVAAHPEAAGLMDRLLAAGLDVNQRSGFSGQTPLMSAARRCCAEGMERLLAAGADPGAVDGNGNTVLHHLVEGPVPTQGREARQALRVRWLRRLMEAGANPALTNRYDETALQAAARLGRGPVIDALLAEQPEQLDAPATRDAMVAALLNGNGATAERLQELGVAVNFWAALLLNDRLAAEWALDEEPWLLTAERPPRGIGPVGYAMKGGHVELARWLLEQGADPTAETFGRILFADALKEDAPYDFFELMFDKGYAAAVDRPDGNGRTPLHRAASARRLDLVQLLLRHGADPNARDHRHHTVLSAAGTDEIRAALLAAGADPDG